ncbi:unnamed protein product, partial [Didymodactylos carnosus]
LNVYEKLERNAKFGQQILSLSLIGDKHFNFNQLTKVLKLLPNLTRLVVEINALRGPGAAVVHLRSLEDLTLKIDFHTTRYTLEDILLCFPNLQNFELSGVCNNIDMV